MRTMAHKQTPQEASAKRTFRPRVGPSHRQALFAPGIQQKPFCPCDGGCPCCRTAIQAKLILGQPGDTCEQEADRVADMVMKMPAPAIQPKPT